MATDSTIFGLEGIGVTETVLLGVPFYRLLRLIEPDGRFRPKLLIVTPLSGHRLPLLRDLVRALVVDLDVHVVDWAEIRQVPLSEGRFGLDENIAAVADILTRLGPDLHVLALSQSVIPTLAASALLAQSDAAAPPLSMILISGFLDRRVNPRQFDVLVAGASVPALGPVVTSRVPAAFPGRGRRIYDASAQRGALIMYWARHVARRRELLWKAIFDDGDDPARFPFMSAYLDIVDLPAELYVDVMTVFFHECSLARGRLTWRGESVRPAAITWTALMTIEGEQDDVSPVGQTRIAHALCPSIASARRAHHVQADVGHFGTFHGRAWRTEIAPRICQFIARVEAANRGRPRGPVLQRLKRIGFGRARTAERRTRGR